MIEAFNGQVFTKEDGNTGILRIYPIDMLSNRTA
jgi:hypothetical protein